MDSFLAVIPVSLIFAIPLFALWSGHRQKVLKLRLQTQSSELAKKVERLIALNEELEARVQTLESIATLEDEAPRHSSRVRVGVENTVAFDTKEARAKTA